MKSTIAALLLIFATLNMQSRGRAQWTGSPWSGVRTIERTDPGPNRVRAFEVDLCDAGMTVRATRPAEANQVLSSWAPAADVQVAVNANMWHCGALCGVGIGNGERFDAVDDNHWGYISFSPENPEYPWDYDTIPPPIWVEQAVGGHPRVVNEGAPVPSFAGNCLERHPRTAAGFSADRTKLILAVVDGRSSSSAGMTCAQLANLMVSLGAHNALNLDGGGSSTAWRADRGVINVPSGGSQRVVRNHLGARSYGEGVPRYCATHRALTPEEGVMRPLSRSVSAAWGFSLLDLRSWPTEYIGAYERGTPVEAPRLVRSADRPLVFLIDHGFKRHVTNPNSLRGFHLHNKSIEVLTRAEVDAFADGPQLTQFPYIAVSPAPEHEAFIVDFPFPFPDPSEPVPTMPDASTGNASTPVDSGEMDAGPADAGAGAASDVVGAGADGATRDELSIGGCGVSRLSDRAPGWVLLVLVLVRTHGRFRFGRR